MPVVGLVLICYDTAGTRSEFAQQRVSSTLLLISMC